MPTVYYQAQHHLGLVDNERGTLHLPNVVEPKHTDEALGEFLLGVVDLLEDLGRVSAAVHWQLVHGPVASIVVSRALVVHAEHTTLVGDLNARNPSHADQVVDLLGHVGLAEIRKVGEGLELLVVIWLPYLETAINGQYETSC